MLCSRTVRTVTGSGKVSSTHWPTVAPGALAQVRQIEPFITLRSISPSFQGVLRELDALIEAPGARLLHFAASSLSGTGIIVWPEWQPMQRDVAPGLP